MTVVLSPEELQRLVLTEQQRREAAGAPGLDPAEATIRETVTMRKFGGDDPQACRPEDLIESIHMTIDNGEVTSRIVEPGPLAVDSI